MVSKSINPCKNDHGVPEFQRHRILGPLSSRTLELWIQEILETQSLSKQSLGYRFLGWNLERCFSLSNQCPCPHPHAQGGAAGCDMPDSLVTSVRQKPGMAA